MAKLYTYVMIQNNSSANLKNVSWESTHGSYSQTPASNIAAGKSATALMKDPSGAAYGSEGWINYDSEDGGVTFSFCCSYEKGGNYAKADCKIPNVKCEIYARTGAEALLAEAGGLKEGNVPTSDHPLAVLFVLSKD